VVLRQRVTELQAETLRSFDRALERNPQFRQSMGSKTQEIQGLITQSLQLLESEVINATEFKLPAKDYFDHFTRTIEALYALNAQAAGNLHRPWTTASPTCSKACCGWRWHWWQHCRSPPAWPWCLCAP